MWAILVIGPKPERDLNDVCKFIICDMFLNLSHVQPPRHHSSSTTSGFWPPSLQLCLKRNGLGLCISTLKLEPHLLLTRMSSLSDFCVLQSLFLGYCSLCFLGTAVYVFGYCSPCFSGYRSLCFLGTEFMKSLFPGPAGLIMRDSMESVKLLLRWEEGEQVVGSHSPNWPS